MNTLFNFKTWPLSTKIALLSFVMGTLLLISYLLFKTSFLINLGFWYVIIAIIINSIMFMYLIFKLLFSKNNKEDIVIEMFLLLSNIPVTVLYFTIVASIH